VTTLKNSCSRVRFVVSSSFSKTIKLEMLDEFKWLSENAPDSLAFHMSPGNCREFDEEGVFLNELCMVRITNQQVYKILSRIDKLLLHTEKGIESKLGKLFEPETRSKSGRWTGYGPGSVKIFSPTLMCWYDGRDWRKIDPKTWF
jgi:hypothetical protein